MTRPAAPASANFWRCAGRAGWPAGPRAVRGALGEAQVAGLISITPDRHDRRRHIVRPTLRLAQIMGFGLAIRLKALEHVRPLPKPAADWAGRPATLALFLGRNVEAYAHGGFILSADYPEVAAFMERRAGYPLLLDLIASCRVVNGGVVATVSPSEAAAHYGVSRAHVRKVLAAGWLTLTGPGGQLRLSAQSYARLRHWIALELAWTARLIG